MSFAFYSRFDTALDLTKLALHPRTMTLAVGLLLFLISSNLPRCRFIGNAQQYKEDPLTFNVFKGPFT